MLTKLVETNEMMLVEKYVNARGLDNIRGCASKEIYEDFLKFCKENKSFFLGYITFRKYLMSKYNLKSQQIRVNNSRIYILR